MEIKHIIIHELQKEAADKSGRPATSQKTLQMDEKAAELAERLDSLFNSGNAQQAHGVFDLGEEKQYPPLFFDYIQSPDEEGFVNFTKKSLFVLNDIITSTAAKGGYFVFMDYQSDAGEFFGIFLLRNSSSFHFNRTGPEQAFEIDSVEHLDLDKFSMACRIDIQKYYTGEGNYLIFTKNSRLSDLSNYFYEWLAVDEEMLHTTKRYTEELLAMTDEMECPLDKEGKEIPREEFRHQVYEYVKESDNKRVNIPDLSKKIFPEKDNYFMNYAKENNFTIDVDFRPDPKTMKKFHRIEAWADNIKIGFEIADLDVNVMIDPEDSSKIIIRSEKLVAKIREQIYRQRE